MLAQPLLFIRPHGKAFASLRRCLPANVLEDMSVKTTKTRTIVFVEDNPVVLTAYRNHLEQAGFHVKPAMDGLEAMKLLSRVVPDMVILDLMLPKFNGVEVLKFIHSNPRLKAIPIIILSTNSILEVTEEYMLERAHKRLLKDACTPLIMLRTVHELFADSDVPDGTPTAAFSDNLQSGNTRTIVFVEDDSVVLTAYRNHLQQAGFQVEPAVDGLEAMKLLSRLVPDVVVLDLMLPKFSGTDVLKFIRSTPHLGSVRVVIHSVSSVIATAEDNILGCADSRLIKGICTPTIMLQTIQKLFASRPKQSTDASATGNTGAGKRKSKAGDFSADIHRAT